MSVLFLENIEVCAMAPGEIWSGRLQVTLSERLRHSSTGRHAYGSAAPPIRPQIKDDVTLEYIHFQNFQSENLPHWSSAVQKILLVQTWSAAAERVFPLPNSSFNDSQSMLSWTIYRLV